MRNMCTLAAALMASSFFACAAHATDIETPGPDQDLFNTPYYSCGTNYYISTTGSDTAAGTSAAPWLTMQHANDALLAGSGTTLPNGSTGVGAGGATSGANVCINVAPGTYIPPKGQNGIYGVNVTVGGDAASSTGYLTYRCTTMDACIIKDNSAGQNGTFTWAQANGPGSYVIVDGFYLKGYTAASTGGYGQGIELWDNEPNGEYDFSVHHVWVLNSIITDFGQSGVQMNNGEYFYVVHNTIFNNSRTGCSAQGSGISFAALKALSGYTQTADDQDNIVVHKIGMLSTTGHPAANAAEWNVVYNNAITQCGNAANPYDTDGNGIIFDTLSGSNTGAPNNPYPNASLAAFNVIYNNGGGGIHIFYSEFVTAANNTIYNTFLDPFTSGAVRAGIDTNGSYSNTIFSNLIVSIPGANDQSYSVCNFSNMPYTMFNSPVLGAPQAGDPPNSANVWSNNIVNNDGPYKSCWGLYQSRDQYAPMYSPDTFPTTGTGANTEGVDPGWVSVGTSSVGTETSQPVGANFALTSTSPAIGKGIHQGYLEYPNYQDVGACYHTLTQCPVAGSQPSIVRSAHPLHAHPYNSLRTH